MTGHAEDTQPVSTRGILSGIGLSTLIGALIGVLVSAASWTRPLTLTGDFAIFAWMVFAGLIVGGAIGVVVGLVLAWHAASVAAEPQAPASAPFWGVFTGLVLGLSFGPFVGFLFGLSVGQLVGGTLLGLVLGPVLGVLSWETGYWLSRLSAR